MPIINGILNKINFKKINKLKKINKKNYFIKLTYILTEIKYYYYEINNIKFSINYFNYSISANNLYEIYTQKN